MNPLQSVSSELLFVDVQRQPIALHELPPAEEMVALLTPPLTAAALRRRLGELLQGVWTER